VEKLSRKEIVRFCQETHSVLVTSDENVDPNARLPTQIANDKGRYRQPRAQSPNSPSPRLRRFDFNPHILARDHADDVWRSQCSETIEASLSIVESARILPVVKDPLQGQIVEDLTLYFGFFHLFVLFSGIDYPYLSDNGEDRAMTPKWLFYARGRM
jgi:hypothetical protein